MSVTARLNRFKDIAYDVTRTTIRVATPMVSATATKVRDRLQRTSQPVPTPVPTPVREPAPEPVRAGPTPATVARNIPPHPPTPSPAEPKVSARSAPGAKLPPRRRTDDD